MTTNDDTAPAAPTYTATVTRYGEGMAVEPIAAE